MQSRKSKGLKKMVSILAVTVLTIGAVFGALASSGSTAYATELNADASSATDWAGYLTDSDGNLSTENVGRVWTDKSVSTGDMTLGSEGDNFTVKKGDSDFLVSLSALSSASNIMTKSSKPLDIVLVLDTSGSMSDKMDTYDKVYASELNTKKSYYIGDSLKGKTKVRYSKKSQSWYYSGLFFDVKVEPKESPEDNNPNHVQFYKKGEGPKKIAALKSAVNNFIDETTNQNVTIDNPERQHRISIVSFSGGAHIKNDLTADTALLKENVDGLIADGATRADKGMEKAQEVLATARENAQTVVVFFTDGEPTKVNSFSEEVANRAIGVSKEIKAKGTPVYSIGVFEEADPSDTKTPFNAYMNGVSSNYPNATKYTALGTPAEKQDYYKVAADSDDLNNIFEGIATEIQQSAQGAPTMADEGMENKSGYITFRDELGAYMKCDGFTDVIFAGKQFNTVSKDAKTDGNGNTVTTYTFEGKDVNNLYEAEGNLKDLVIKVTSYKDLAKGDLVEVKVPASLIPVRYFDVNDGKMTVKEAQPISIVYGASVKEGVIEDVVKDGKIVKLALVKNPDEQFKAYLGDKKNVTKDGQVKFFSNMWVGNDNGDTTAAFEPATGNNFYRFTENKQLFIKKADGTVQEVKSLRDIHVSLTDEYFVENEYYTAANSGGAAAKVKGKTFIRVNSLSDLGSWMTEKDGKVYIKQGTAKDFRVNDFTNVAKEANLTGTAKYAINTMWNAAGIVAYLGNNGVATKDAGGVLSVSKTAKLAEGMTGPVDADGNSTLDKQEFNFEIAADVKDGEYTAVVFKKTANGETASEPTAVKFENGKANLTLKNKERAEVYGIKTGTEFTVKETAMPKGFKQVTPADNKPVKGTVTYKETAKADFVNEYKAETAQFDTGKAAFTKELKDRDWMDSDEFTFVMEKAAFNGKTSGAGFDNMPVPAKAQITVTKANSDKAFSFGSMSFTKPGVYEYTVKELKGDLGGITYDSKTRNVKITVTDNGEGVLTADCKVDDNKFVNKYDAKGSITLDGTKKISGRDFERGDKFEFAISSADQNAPLPKDKVVSIEPSQGAKAEFTLGEIKFTQTDMAGAKVENGKRVKDFVYNVTETKGNAEDMTYDAAPKTVTVTVTDDMKGKLTAVVKDGSDKLVWTNVYFGGDAKGVQDKDGTDVNGGNVAVGDVLTYTIKWVNNATDTNGRLADAKVTITDKIPAGTEYVEGSAEGASYNKAEKTLTWTVDAKAAETGTVSFKAKVTEAAAKTEIKNSAAVKVGNNNPKQTNEVTTFVPGKEASLEGNDAQAQVGKKLTYTITYKNTEKSPATVVIKDKIPSGTAYVEGSATEGAVYNKADKTLTWTFKNVAAGKIGSVSFDVKITEDALKYDGINNTASVQVGANKSVSTNTAETVLEENGQLTISKKVAVIDGEGTSIAKDKEFEFTVKLFDAAKGDNKTELKESYGIEIAGSDAGTIKSGDKIKLKHGESAVIKGLPAGAGYVVTEADYAGYTPDSKSKAGNIEKDTKIEFTNTYSVAGNPAKANVNAKKVLTYFGNESDQMKLKDKQFSFELKGDSLNAPMTALNDADGNVVFGEIALKSAGKHVFTMSEVQGQMGGITYDNSKYKVVINVIDNGDGTLTAEAPQYVLGNDAVDTATFINDYNADFGGKDPEINITGFKKLTGRDLKDGEFTFSVKDEEGKVVSTGTNDGRGNIAFAPFGLGYTTNTTIVVDEPVNQVDTDMQPEEGFIAEGVDNNMNVPEEQVPAGDDNRGFDAYIGDHWYTVTENGTDGNGIVLDKTVYKVKVTVTDNGEGMLVVSDPEYYLENEVVDEMVFNNAYSAKSVTEIIKAHKLLLGRKLKDGEFTFVLTEDGKEVARAANDAEGNIAFEMTYDAVGEHAYKIAEVKGDEENMTYDESVYDVKVVVTDDGMGQLEAAVTYPEDGVVFNNKYQKPEPAPVEKPEKPEKPNGPKTGDNAPVGALMMFIGAAVAFVVTMNEKRKSSKR